jgi:hypothetical protein
MNDEVNLEEAFRAGLQRRAGDVDTTVDLLGPATSAVRGQRRRRVAIGSVGLVAAALVTAVVVQNTGGSAGPDHPQVVDEGLSEPLPTEWRTEAWHGLQVEVPADWGWGGAPDACGVGVVFKPPFGERGGVDETTPYVGRPISNTDACGSPVLPTTADVVWLDPEWPLGIRDLGNGYTSETVDVLGSRLTVSTDNPALRRHILESARAPESCAPSLTSAPHVDSMLTEGLRNPSSAQVCAYQRDYEDESAPFELVYATTLGEKDAAIYHSQVYDGSFESSPDFCDNSSERVLITITGEDPYGGAGSEVTQETVVDPFCREASGSPGMANALSDKGMAAWSSNGAAVTLYGLIGPQG